MTIPSGTPYPPVAPSAAPSAAQGAARPTAAFIGASWAALLTGSAGYLIGLWNAHLALSEKGYYLTLLLFGLFGSISLQKAVRDRAEGIPVTGLYYAIAWVAVAASLLLTTIGLWNAGMARSEKGFYAMAYALSLFAVVAVQKNVRDLAASTPLGTPVSTPAGTAAETGIWPEDYPRG